VGLSVRLRHAMRALVAPAESPAVAEPPPPPEVPTDLVPLLRELGAALLSSGQSVVETEHQLAAVAQAHGADQVRALVLPTGVFLQVDTANGPTADFTGPGTSGTLPLHQIGALDSLVRRLLHSDADLGDARTELRAILASPPRYGPLVVILGHGLLTLGFGLILYPTVDSVPVYLALGAAMGALRLLASRWPTLDAGLPVFAALLVSLVTIEYIAPWVGGDPLRLLTPALVSFLPGAVLTVAAIELTSNQVVAGASRMVYGVAQLLLLAFGVVAAVSLTGAWETTPHGGTLNRWIGLVGVLAVAIGYRFYSSTPPGAFWWLLAALYAAFLAQRLGTVLLTPELGGFIGGLVIAPVAQVIARARSGPPAIVVMLPAFWLLVPGALGFQGLSEVATGASVGLADLVDTAIALFSIALGVLVGTSLTRDARQMSHFVARAVDPSKRARH
jgi:uncharacterized membrane protein YjjP (DUF1212 family)